LGLMVVPCIRIDHLTDEEQRTLRLAVNRLGEKGEWDVEELKIEFEELILTEAPIEISGFSLEEIDQILLGWRGNRRGRTGPACTRARRRSGCAPWRHILSRRT
jgi:hypothetical protein